MRSNDAYFGLPHDVFCFTMLQEMMCGRLGVHLGCYIHHAGSMHVYDQYVEAMQEYVNEGYQRPNAMPPMPAGDPFEIVARLLEAEDLIKQGNSVKAEEFIGDPYWADIIRLVQVFWASGQGDWLDELKKQFVHSVYLSYLDGRRQMMIRSPKTREADGGNP